MTATNLRPNVVVVGAGMAGIACAASIKDAGFNVVVLEANRRIGGRIWTSEIGGTVIERGAEFIHGDQASIWELVENAGSPSLKQAKTREIFSKDLKNITLASQQEYEEIVEAMHSYTGPDITVKSYIDTLSVSNNLKEILKRKFEDYESGSASDISLKSMAYSSGLSVNGTGNYFLPEGYTKLILPLANDLDIKLDTPVKKISFKDDLLSVIVQDEIYQPQVVVITASIGVLKTNGLHFSPALPTKFHNALDQVGFGNIVKINFVFIEELFRERLAVDSTFASWWPRNFGNHAGAVCFIGGNRVKSLSTLSDQAIVSEATDVLKRVIGKNVSSKCIKVAVDRWDHKKNFINGAYVFPLEKFSDAQNTLLHPYYSGRLYFAGEGLNRNGHHATVHGAYESGLEIARRVINSLRQS